ncbi:MAG: hypothetical protein U5K76_04025 [Woeseiaceae bacterium]|nr:hypothetical protein [Woeseiaceae bacterium]
MNNRILFRLLPAALLLAGCGAEQAADTGSGDAWASRYEALPSGATLLRGATVLTGTGERLDGADIRIEDGRIAAVGPDLAAGEAETVDAGGLWITPGIIDVHSHLGVYASPGVEAHSDGNEGNGTEYRGSLGRAQRLAAGPGLRHGARRRRHDAADPAGLGEPVWRPQRDAQERAGPNRNGHEVPRRAARAEDGLRRKPEARLRQSWHGPLHAHGQRCRVPQRLDRGRRLSREEAGRSETAKAKRRHAT